LFSYIAVFAFIVKRFRVFRAPLQLYNTELVSGGSLVVESDC
jgi:hypothetical protein